MSACRLFIDSFILLLTHTKRCIIEEALRQNYEDLSLSDEELDECIAIFYARGISGTNDYSITSIWSNDWGIPFCKTTMYRNRFVNFLHYLRIDEKSNRSQRLKTDKFAFFSIIWDRFNDNCIACYKPGPDITVDEQLFPTKTRCSFTQYIPSKANNYGHEY